MHARMMPRVAMAFVALCFSYVASAADGGRSRHTPTSIRGKPAGSRPANAGSIVLHTTSWKQRAARRLWDARDPYADPAAIYKANRLSSQPAQRITNIPGQTTVLTRKVIDDKDTTTLGDALRTTPGVTVGR
jgi:outer membrane receptor for monomeric catechols